jgi:hypothetical protein
MERENENSQSEIVLETCLEDSSDCSSAVMTSLAERKKKMTMKKQSPRQE